MQNRGVEIDVLRHKMLQLLAAYKILHTKDLSAITFFTETQQ
jgi:hypothetical protein